MLLFLVAVFSGCSETDERAYVGKNSIYIRTEGDPVILAMDDEPLKATLMLIRAYDKDVSFEIGNGESSYRDYSGRRKERGF